MKNKLGTFFMILGVLLIAGSLALLLYNGNEDKKAGEAVDTLLPDIIEVINEKAAQNKKDSAAPIHPCTETPHVNPYNEQAVLVSYEMNTVEIDGYEYIGYISIPTIELNLPVMADWSYKKLKISPCRQFGSVKSDDLVIVGHNYARHFGNIYKLKPGDIMTFTDADGNITVYSLLAVEQLAATDVAALKKGEWDLTLYTCTYGGRNRIVVRFRRIEQSN